MLENVSADTVLPCKKRNPATFQCKHQVLNLETHSSACTTCLSGFEPHVVQPSVSSYIRGHAKLVEGKDGRKHAEIEGEHKTVEGTGY
jgi:hypothetical protein